MSGRGTVVNVTSIAGTMPPPMASAHAGSKGALSLATDALRMELHGSGVHVMLVIPGPVETEMFAEGRAIAAAIIDGSPRGTPPVLARKIADGIERRRELLVYPAWAALSHYLPMVARAISRRAFRRMPIEHQWVLRAGSAGAPAITAERQRQARLAAPMAGEVS